MLLAVAITPSGTAQDEHRDPRSDRPDEHRQPAVERAPHPRRTTQARLADRRTIERIPIRRHVIDADGDNVAAAQLLFMARGVQASR
jgi:hypothetical protein